MYQPRKIVVAIDFSAHSEPALETAIDIAKREGAELHVAHAVEIPTAVFSAYAFEVPANFINDARQQASLRVEEAVKRATDRGVEAKGQVRSGPPAATIDELAKELGADLIVVGTHGHTGFKHLALGSVAERILRHSPCNVLVVKRPEDAAKAD